MRLTVRAARRRPGYYESYAAQLGGLSVAGQRRLRSSTALIVGAGRLGHAVALTLATSGIGRLVIVDPQRLSASDLNRCATARSRDIGRWKVDSTAGLIQGRPFLEVVPIVGRAENLASLPEAGEPSIVIAACNTRHARAAVAGFAAERQIRHVAAGIADARLSVGGVVMAWTPRDPDLACPACFLKPGGRLPRSESLLAPVVAVVASTAAWYVVTLLSHGRDFRLHTNCIAIDLGTFTMDAFRALRRPDCSSCRRRAAE
jgi:adenylyltransferase/sulfurtransferase